MQIPFNGTNFIKHAINAAHISVWLVAPNP